MTKGDCHENRWGDIKQNYQNPEEWIKLVKEYRYSAVIAPIGQEASSDEKEAYVKAAKENDLVIGEVGIWRNPLSTDPAKAKADLEYCKQRLALAEELGANCCVNIVGARGELWDGFYKENYSKQVYTMIVDVTREIIDSVNPKRTYYTLEPMPWMIPDSPDAYLKLIKDIDRKSFAVHLDYTNMINSPERYLKQELFIEECFHKLGPYIKSIHAKDVIMEKNLPCVIREVMPGKGSVDFKKVARLCERLGKDTTVFVEHLDTPEEYRQAAGYIRTAAEQVGVFVLG